MELSLRYKRVPAIEKCFSILTLIAEEKRPMGYSEIVKRLSLNKSTVFNMLHTLADLDILEKGGDCLFRLGSRLFLLGSVAGMGSEWIQTVHPYLVSINKTFRVSAFFGLLFNREVLIADKADQAQQIRISSDIGMKIPVFAGVAGKALLSQLPDEDIDRVLSEYRPKKYTSKTILDQSALKKEILMVRKNGIAYDREEYIEGLVAAAIPIRTQRDQLQAAVWAVGFKHQFQGKAMTEITEFLLHASAEINERFSIMAASNGYPQERHTSTGGK